MENVSDNKFSRAFGTKQNVSPPAFCLPLCCCARRKKVVCVLKSYTPRPEVSVPGSPVASERAPLTEHAMRLPHSSPSLQRGEILIQWKDGTVTPLYEAWSLRRFSGFGRGRVGANKHGFLCKHVIFWMCLRGKVTFSVVSDCFVQNEN